MTNKDETMGIEKIRNANANYSEMKEKKEQIYFADVKQNGSDDVKTSDYIVNAPDYYSNIEQNGSDIKTIDYMPENETIQAE